MSQWPSQLVRYGFKIATGQISRRSCPLRIRHRKHRGGKGESKEIEKERERSRLCKGVSVTLLKEISPFCGQRARVKVVPPFGSEPTGIAQRGADLIWQRKFQQSKLGHWAAGLTPHSLCYDTVSITSLEHLCRLFTQPSTPSVPHRNITSLLSKASSRMNRTMYFL